MESNGDCADVSRIISEIETLKAAKNDIENRISVLEAELRESTITQPINNTVSNGSRCPIYTVDSGLSPKMIYRYSRHLLLPSFGVEAQSNLLKSSILVIGAGGLGSPALLYLAACGVGRMGIVDHDVVELNNMHRQVIHTEAYIGQSKVKSAAAACRSINSTIQIVEHREALRTSNALEIMSQYDIVVDATDNAPSRYMISDCCVVLGKVKIRGRSSQCEACGENSTFTQDHFRNFDYEKFTQSPLSTLPLKLNLLSADSRISSKEYKEKVVNGEAHVLVDVRPAHHFKIVSLPNSINIPLTNLESRSPEISSAMQEKEEHEGSNAGSGAGLYVVCRRGNDSQRAVQVLHKMGLTSARDIIGGLESWANDVDPNFPTY